MAKNKKPKIGEPGRGHAFGRVGAGRSTSFKDKRRQSRTTQKIQFKKGE